MCANLRRDSHGHAGPSSGGKESGRVGKRGREGKRGGGVGARGGRGVGLGTSGGVSLAGQRRSGGGGNDVEDEDEDIDGLHPLFEKLLDMMGAQPAQGDGQRKRPRSVENDTEDFTEGERQPTKTGAKRSRARASAGSGSPGVAEAAAGGGGGGGGGDSGGGDDPGSLLLPMSGSCKGREGARSGGPPSKEPTEQRLQRQAWNRRRLQMRK